MRPNRPLSLFLLAGSTLVAPGLAVSAAAGVVRPASIHAVAPQAADLDPIVGSWRPRAYRLAAGAELPVDGRIVFLARSDDGSRGEWSVNFFVTGEDGAAVRGSAEGGEWSRDGRSLLLTHQFHLSAGAAAGPLPEAPLAMAFRSAAEAARNHR
ncbi:MAG: hypothetical protein OXP70_13545, partial [Acidobacteriota bacterium]|nr:hypothetical protein [Acidobacteriota bacterium]